MSDGSHRRPHRPVRTRQELGRPGEVTATAPNVVPSVGGTFVLVVAIGLLVTLVAHP